MPRSGDARAAKPLISALGDVEWYVGATAAADLGFIRDMRAVEPMLTALHAADGLIRLTAADALEQIGTEEALVAVKAWRKARGK
jgi:HEAT repeat protein